MTQPKLHYSIHAIMDHDIVDQWCRWMQEEHIPEVLATGKFLTCRFLRSPHLENQFAIEYVCKDAATFKEYEEQCAPALREKTHAQFGDHCRMQRLIYEEVQTWDCSGSSKT